MSIHRISKLISLIWIMDGYQVLDTLLHMARTFEIPFIFSTAMSEKVNREQALKLGADDYIIRPFELESLLKITNSWIKSGSLRHQVSLKEMTTKRPVYLLGEFLTIFLYRQ